MPAGPFSTELADRLQSVIADQREGIIAVHAGHYMLRADDGKACDHLDEAAPANLAWADLTSFAKRTWELGCSLVRADRAHNARLLVLCNDWQFLTPAAPYRREREHIAEAMRRDYYARVRSLPVFHLNTMSYLGVLPDAVLRATEDRWLFSEMALRNALVRRLAGVMRDRQMMRDLGLHTEFSEHGEPIVKLDCEGDSQTLLHCGTTNCSGEVIELLCQLFARGVSAFINIYPAQCRQPVLAGSRLANELFGTTNMYVLNVAVAGNAEKSRVIVDEPNGRTTLYGSVVGNESDPILSAPI